MVRKENKFVNIATVNELYGIMEGKCRGTEEKIHITANLKKEIVQNFVELGTIIPSYLVGVETDFFNDKVISIIVYTNDGRLKKIRGTRFVDLFDNGAEFAWNFVLDTEPCILCQKDYKKYGKIYQDYKGLTTVQA